MREWRLTMSLLPSEQRALAAIEVSLRASDPKLAAMLATFTLPPTARLTSRAMALAITVVAICSVIAGWLISSA
jgi:hypothetical protein